MDFNIAKFHLLSVTNRRKSSVRHYSVDLQELSSVAKYDYLGFRYWRDLRWNNHCSSTASKASRMLGLIRRTLKPCCSVVKELVYLSVVVTPIVEYATTVWNLYTTKDIAKLEPVQKIAARFGRISTSTSSLVSTLNCDTLKYRQMLAQLSLFYKMRNDHINIQFPQCITPNVRRTRRNGSVYVRPAFGQPTPV